MKKAKRQGECVYLRDWTERWFDRLSIGTEMIELIKLMVKGAAALCAAFVSSS